MTGSGSAVFAQTSRSLDWHDAPAAWQIRVCENLRVHPLAEWARDDEQTVDRACG
jgi:4-diphosphocytidyl-2-C-methyl-D-erythritol kinase